MCHIKQGSVPRGTKYLRVLLLFGVFIIFTVIYSVNRNESHYNDNVTNIRYHTGIFSRVTTFHKIFFRAGENNIELEQNNTNLQKTLCPLPKLDPFSPEMMSLMNDTIMRMNYSCRDDPALGIFKDAAFHVVRGNHLIRDVNLPDGVKCCYRKVERVDDEEIRVGTECRHIENKRTEIPYPVELIAVNCTTAKDEIYYIDGFQILHEKPEVEERIRAYHQKISLNKSVNTDESTLSVIIVGLDTTSQMHFERSMPLSKKYLDTNLSAIRLMGYNKVADNTLPNILPLLTGLFWEELTNSCFFVNETVKKGDSKIEIKNCTYIWDNFAENGYRTSYYEDEMPISIFNLYYHNAFRDKTPTDYYWRPYGILMEDHLNFSDFCYGPRLHLQSLLDNVLATAEFFRNRRHFNFVFSTDLSHDSPNTLSWGDKHVLEFLQNLHSKELLNNTALFLLGDHGVRSRDDVEQAMIENRQPLSYVVLPPWFSQRFSLAFANLEWNAKNSVLSPFDLYKTFFDFMDLRRLNDDKLKPGQAENQENSVEKGQSIFEISRTGRNCETAGIPYMWCLCHTRVPLKHDSYLGAMAAETAIAAVNRRMKHFVDCEKLKVGEILSASVMIPNEETFYKKPGCLLLITEGNKTFHHVFHEMVKMDIKTFQDGNTCEEDIIIQVRFLGYPLNPVFKTTVLRNTRGTFSAPNKVIRSDWYSDKGHCVENDFRPYCICKDVVEGASLDELMQLS